MFRLWPFIFLFFSGLSALSYQVVWMREFRLVFGASTASTAAVSALFMAGLGLGGWLLGPKADKQNRPLLLYGRLELGISILAGLSPLLLSLTRALYLKSGGMLVLGLGGATAARLALAAVVIGVPAFLMGGTLPAAAKAVTAEHDGSRLNLGALYGINTIGALCGTLLTTFFLMETFGARYTLFFAVIINFLTALAAITVSSKAPATEAASEPALAETPLETAPAKIKGGLPTGLALAAALLVGLAFFLMELVWYRMLGPVLGGSIYTFGLILATALAGIGLGGALHPIVFRNRVPSAWHLAMTCLLEALAMMLPYAAGDWVAVLAAQLRPLAALGFGGLAGSWIMITLLVVFPAAVISGIQFPLLISLLGKGSKGLGRQTGLAYACNTTGAIIGSLAGGFGLMPWLTAPGCWLLVGGLLLLLSVVIAFSAGASMATTTVSWKQHGLPTIFIFTILVLTGLCLNAQGPTAAWRHSPVGAGRVGVASSINQIRGWLTNTQSVTLWEADGVESSVSIDGANGFSFLVNGKSDGNVIGDKGTQIMIGLIGAALHPNPQSALVVGLGTGCTAGWLSAVPSITKVDVVELEPAVINMARLSAPANHNVVAKAEAGEGVRIIINDAREVLNTVPEKYDLIASEPSNPYRAGIASLFTREFYQEVANRLTSDGLFLSWCQAYEISGETVFSILATMKTVFPYVECWSTQYPGDLMFLASMKPIQPDAKKLTDRLDTFPYKEAMRTAWGTEGLDNFVSHHLANNNFVEIITKGAKPSEINTDDRTPVEYAYANTVGQTTNFSATALHTVALNRHMSQPLWLPPESEAGDLALALSLHTSIYNSQRLNVEIPNLNEAQKKRQQAAANWFAGDYSQLAEAWPGEDLPPTKLESLIFAASLAHLGQEKALTVLENCREWWPASSAIVKAALAHKQQNPELAVSQLEDAFKALKSSPWEAESFIDWGFRLALDLGKADTQYAARLYAALEEPLALNFFESRRRLVLFDLADLVSPQAAEKVLQRWFEPHPPWIADFLSKRAATYLATQNPLLGKASLDYEQYMKATDLSVDTLLFLRGGKAGGNEKASPLGGK
ncbi:MAG: fused MFS/spermidine synthase [Candidatus Adiutrix sp.]|nr:fused MFS/spermidine synthase [Candidatus Adiutrix sp.]